MRLEASETGGQHGAMSAVQRFGKRRAPLLVGLVACVAVACGRQGGEPSRLTFTVQGQVLATPSLVPVAGALVQATGNNVDGVSTTITVATNTQGAFGLAGLRDHVALRAIKEGFYPATSSVLADRDRTQDLLMEVAVPLAAEGDDLVLGRTVHSTLGATDARCDPQWDRNAPCRHLGFVPTATRTHQFVFRTAASCPELEFHIFEGLTRVTLASGTNRFTVDVNLTAGKDYVLRLMAYYTCDWFEVTVN